MNTIRDIKIIFISRSYPPIIGGIETLNYELAESLAKLTPTKIIANRCGKFFLPFFLPYALFRSLILLRRQYDAVILGDGVLGIVGWFLKLFSKKPVFCVVVGLDLTYNSNLYQNIWVKIFIKSIDKLIAISRATMAAGVSRGIPRKKFTIIPVGINPNKYYRPGYARRDLENVIGKLPSDCKVILTIGRLVKRKGVAWFVEKVLPNIRGEVVYLIAGEGPEEKQIKKIIEDKNLENKIRLLGKITEKDKEILLNTCDIFVQPNIEIKGDIEGFGIAVIEAASCGRVVVAADIEGLQDAICDGKNGFMVKSHDADDYERKITQLLSDDNFRKQFGERARQFVIENYNWKSIAEKYLTELSPTLKA